MPGAHPAHGDEIVAAGDGPVQRAVFRHAVPARPVVDLHLHDARALELHERGQEAVHAAEHGQAPGHVRAHDLQRAAGVGDRPAGHGRAHGVADLGRDALHEAVLALGPPAADHVRAGAVSRKKARDVGRVVLQVGVHGDDDPAPGGLEAGLEGRGLAAVGGEGEVAHRIVSGGQGLDDGKACIRAAVVDEDDLPGPAKGFHGGAYLPEQYGQVGFLVVDRDDQGELDGWRHGSKG